MRFNLVIEIEAKDVQWCPNHDLLTYGFPGKHDWTAISNFYRLFKFESYANSGVIRWQCL